MLAALTLAAIAVGILLGRLYSFVAVLIVSPFAWVIALVVLLFRHWSLWQAFFVAIAVVFVLQVAYLAGIRIRLKKEDSLPKAASPLDHATEQSRLVRQGKRIV